jgi:hypothetical protein
MSMYSTLRWFLAVGSSLAACACETSDGGGQNVVAGAAGVAEARGTAGSGQAEAGTGGRLPEAAGAPSGGKHSNGGETSEQGGQGGAATAPEGGAPEPQPSEAGRGGTGPGSEGGAAEPHPSGGAPEDHPSGGDGSAEAGQNAGGGAREPTAGAPSAPPAGGAAGARGEAGGSATGPDVPDLPEPDSVTLRGPCPITERVGDVVVATYEDQDSTSLLGTVNDGIDPVKLPDLLLDEGACKLWRRRHLECDPSCSSGNTCNADGECQPMVRAQNLGTVTIDGLGTSLELEPTQPGNLYFADVDYSSASPAEIVRLSTTTGYAGEQELFAFGVAPLELITGRWLFKQGSPLTIKWRTGESPSSARIAIDVSVDQHGTTPARLLCDADDTGALAISAEVVDTLLEAGVTGFPSAMIARRSVDSTDVPDGCMEFAVESVRTPDVAVAGYTPCSNQSMCPEGQTCNLTLERCEG